VTARVNGVRYTRLRLRDGYSVSWWGTVYGLVLRDGSEWTIEPHDGPVVWARYARRDDAARDMLSMAGVRA
jgi:hypothetical protein